MRKIIKYIGYFFIAYIQIVILEYFSGSWNEYSWISIFCVTLLVAIIILILNTNKNKNKYKNKNKKWNGTRTHENEYWEELENCFWTMKIFRNFLKESENYDDSLLTKSKYTWYYSSFS